MKLIGVLGGTSWPSTILLYRMLNSHVQRRLGGYHSARVLLYSIDYQAIKSRYQDGWSEIPLLLKSEIGHLLAGRPDCWIIANNSLHKAYDAVADQLHSQVPFFHAVHLVRDEVVKSGFQNVLLLGTKFTMEDGFFASALEARGNKVHIPDATEREQIQQIQTRLAKGSLDPAFTEYFRALMRKYFHRGCEAVITACTELPLVINQRLTAMHVIDPLELQSQACIQFALAGDAAVPSLPTNRTSGDDVQPHASGSKANAGVSWSPPEKAGRLEL